MDITSFGYGLITGLLFGILMVISYKYTITQIATSSQRENIFGKWYSIMPEGYQPSGMFTGYYKGMKGRLYYNHQEDLFWGRIEGLEPKAFFAESIGKLKLEFEKQVESHLESKVAPNK